jgi:hypothetical protein
MFAVTTGSHMFSFNIPWRVAAGANALKIGLIFPAFSSCSIVANAPVAAPGVSESFNGRISNTGVFITFTSAPTLINNYCTIDGIITFTAAGTMAVIYGAEAASASAVTVMAGGGGIIWAMQ